MLKDRGVYQGRYGGPGVEQFLEPRFRSSAPNAVYIRGGLFLHLLGVHANQFTSQVIGDGFEIPAIQPHSMAFRTPINEDRRLPENGGDHFDVLALDAGAMGSNRAGPVDVLDLRVQPAQRSVFHSILEFSQFIFGKPNPFALRASFEIHGKNGVLIELVFASRTVVQGVLIQPGALDGQDFHLEIRFLASFRDPFEPVRNMHVVHKIGKSLAAYRHRSGEVFVDKIEFAAIKPKSATVPAIMQKDIVRFQEPHLGQMEVVTPGALLYLLLRFVVLFLFAVLDAPLNAKRHFVQLSRVQPETAAFLAQVIGNGAFFRDDLVAGHLGAAAQTFHLWIPSFGSGLKEEPYVGHTLGSSSDGLESMHTFAGGGPGPDRSRQPSQPTQQTGIPSRRR